MSKYVHTRITADEDRLLSDLVKSSGKSISELVRSGLKLLHEREESGKSALDICRGSVGKFAAPKSDLSLKKKHLIGYGR